MTLPMMPLQELVGGATLDREAVTIPRLELTVERENGAIVNRVVTCEGDILRIGSHRSNHVVLEDPLVSRFHCCAKLEQQGWKLFDTGSLNGTRINGVRVRDVDLPLPDCRIELGNSVVRMRELGSVGSDEVPISPSFGALYGASLVMRKLYALVERVGRSDASVLIEGESGTGKELVANEIVQRSARADKPLVVFDCGAVSPTLIESRLFGHLRGSFTGADRDRIGAFEAAHGGTLFLDEIGELPLDMQPKLLRALEAREICRLGEHQARKVDVRVIAATNRMLEREVNHGRFREDLYYRLSVVTIHVPPLRERLEDLEALVRAILRDRSDTGAERLFTRQVLSEMARYDWPGNVRELRNYVERAIVLQAVGPATRPEDRSSRAPVTCANRSSGAEDAYPNSSTTPNVGVGIGVSVNASSTPNANPSFNATASATPNANPNFNANPNLEPKPNIDISFSMAKDAAIERFERAYLAELLKWSGGNVSQAARKAGMDRMHLHRLVQKHGLRGNGNG